MTAHKDDRKQKGGAGEDLAARHLRTKGYRIVERNYSCKMGEIDIIAEKDEYLVFCEVKYRGQADFGGALAAITPAKQRKLRALASYYYHFVAKDSQLTCRFDVVAVQRSSAGEPDVLHLENAFM